MVRFFPPSPVCDDAEFSNDGAERLWLSRKVADTGPVGLIIGLNPSIAGAAREDTDHTITKGIVFARSWGWSGFWMANLFTCIETYSQNLKNMSHDAAVGGFGDRVLEEMIPCAPEIVVCWGAAVPKSMRHRIQTVCNKIRTFKRREATVRCFGLSKGGDPVHPLYLSYDTPMVEFELIERPSRR